MKILDEIERIVYVIQEAQEDGTGGSFLYESFLNINSWIDEQPLPCVCVQRLVGAGLINEGGQIKRSADFLIMFLDQTEFDEQALENQGIIDDQETLTIAFIRQVNNSSIINIVGETKIDYIYDEFDLNVTGVALRVTLKELSGAVECFRSEVVPPEDFPSET